MGTLTVCPLCRSKYTIAELYVKLIEYLKTQAKEQLERLEKAFSTAKKNVKGMKKTPPKCLGERDICSRKTQNKCLWWSRCYVKTLEKKLKRERV